MRDGNSETETELQAAERRISKLQRCGAARVASMQLDENILSKDEYAKAQKGQRHFKDEGF